MTAAAENDKARRRMIRHLRRGGCIVREDAGGAVGVFWKRADRSGPHFDQVVGDRLLDGGCRAKGKRFALHRVDGLQTDTYQLLELGEAVAA